jgi:hypothetical protein
VGANGGRLAITLGATAGRLADPVVPFGRGVPPRAAMGRGHATAGRERQSVRRACVAPPTHQIRGGHANGPTICDCGTEGLVRRQQASGPALGLPGLPVSRPRCGGRRPCDRGPRASIPRGGPVSHRRSTGSARRPGLLAHDPRLRYRPGARRQAGGGLPRGCRRAYPNVRQAARTRMPARGRGTSATPNQFLPFDPGFPTPQWAAAMRPRAANGHLCGGARRLWSPVLRLRYRGPWTRQQLVDGASVSCWWRSIPFLRLVQGFSSSRKPSSEWAICCAFGKPLR